MVVPAFVGIVSFCAGSVQTVVSHRGSEVVLESKKLWTGVMSRLRMQGQLCFCTNALRKNGSRI
jgi:hypothetical protein